MCEGHIGQRPLGLRTLGPKMTYSLFNNYANPISVRMASGELLILSQAAFSNSICDRLSEIVVTPVPVPERPKPSRMRLWDDNPRPLKRRKC